MSVMSVVNKKLVASLKASCEHETSVATAVQLPYFVRYRRLKLRAESEFYFVTYSKNGNECWYLVSKNQLFNFVRTKADFDLIAISAANIPDTVQDKAINRWKNANGNRSKYCLAGQTLVWTVKLLFEKDIQLFELMMTMEALAT